MRKIRIGLDVDDVIADYTGHYLTLATNITYTAYSKSDIKEWDIHKSLNLPIWAVNEINAALSRPGAAHRLPMIPGAFSGVRKLIRDFDVVFVTAPLTRCPTWAHDR